MHTTVFLLTAKQEGVDSLPYNLRGWPSFERLVSMILTPNTRNVWPMIVDVGAMIDADEVMPKGGYCARLVPQSVPRFQALMRSKKFTNGADCEVVIGLYKATLESVLGTAPQLKMLGNHSWGDEEMRSLVEVLPMCTEATLLDISVSFNNITAEGVEALTRLVDAGKLPPKLKQINWWGGASSRVKGELKAACGRRGVDASYIY